MSMIFASLQPIIYIAHSILARSPSSRLVIFVRLCVMHLISASSTFRLRTGFSSPLTFPSMPSDQPRCLKDVTYHSSKCYTLQWLIHLVTNLPCIGFRTVIPFHDWCGYIASSLL